MLPKLIEEYKKETKALYTSSKEKITDKKFRCKFFDWLKKSLDLNIVIAYFYKSNPKYIEDKHCLLDIIYPEVQLCAYNNNIIKLREGVS